MCPCHGNSVLYKGGIRCSINTCIALGQYITKLMINGCCVKQGQRFLCFERAHTHTHMFRAQGSRGSCISLASVSHSHFRRDLHKANQWITQIHTHSPMSFHIHTWSTFCTYESVYKLSAFRRHTETFIFSLEISCEHLLTHVFMKVAHAFCVNMGCSV